MAYDDTIFVCMACAKRSNDPYGYSPIDEGWDISCYMNCVEVKQSHLNRNPSTGEIEIEDGGIIQPTVEKLLGNDDDKQS